MSRFKPALTPALALVALLVLAWPAGPASAQPPQRLLGFARHLAETGEPDRAVTEFRRFLFLYPDHPEAPQAGLDLAQAYLSLGQADKAVSQLGQTDLVPGGRLKGRALILLARAQALQGKFDQAQKLLGQVAANSEFPAQVRDRAQYDLGWLYLNQSRFKEAEGVFSQIGPASPLGLRAAFLAKEAGLGDKLEKKSALWAGILSGLLPGLGQLYVGRKSDAAWAFSLSLGPGALSWLALSAGSWVSGGLTAAVALAFYGGNIYNAVNLAHRFNRSAADRFRARLKNQAQALPRD
ncbi:MAG: tetratricopeptide repeat protein [Deltaproteobacteria bacterium]|nr:tetratricopeptide repeat protein [Deltaproteobacteria bacterium]